jgi:hypothetical protein
MSEILPSCTSVEAFLLSEHQNNLVSLTTAKNPNSKPIFKWNNNYSWTFNGNLAGKSQIKEEVKSKGGEITGVLRFSAIWNDENKNDSSDLDLWCSQPNRVLIGYDKGYRKDSGNQFTSFGGQLDLDDRGTFNKVDGVYKFWIHQFAARNSQGFKAEIEFNGEVYSYVYDRAVHGNIHIAEVTLKDGLFSIEHKLPCTEGEGVSKEIYGLETNQFHKVNLVCLSPNHWEGNNVGNKHYFFMLSNCKTTESIRSFHNENLIPELAQHRKVLEVLGNTSMITPDEKQLSGLGFNATVRDEVILKLAGSFKRVIKVKF